MDEVLSNDRLDKVMRDKVAVLMNACTNSAQHYDDYYKGFAGLDGKAQSTATISGLVLAAVAAFLKDGRVPELVCSSRLWIIAIIIPPAGALLSVLLALFGTKITEVVVPFDAPEQIREANNIADLSEVEFSQEHVLRYFSARLDHWKNALDDIRECAEKKAYWVLRAQIVLAVSLTFLLILYVAVLVKDSGCLHPSG